MSSWPDPHFRFGAALWWSRYCAAWWTTAGVLTICGALAGFLHLGLGALVLVAVVAALAAVLGQPARCRVAGTPGSAPPMILDLVCGVVALAVLGWFLLLGVAGWWLSVLMAVAGLPVRGRCGRHTAAQQQQQQSTRPQPDRTGPTPLAPTTPPPPVVPLPEPSTCALLSTEQLCWTWRISYLSATRSPGADELERVARVRRRCLDELQQRDPVAFAGWFPTARAASDPTRFFCGRPQPSRMPPPPRAEGCLSPDAGGVSVDRGRERPGTCGRPEAAKSQPGVEPGRPSEGNTGAGGEPGDRSRRREAQ